MPTKLKLLVTDMITYVKINFFNLSFHIFDQEPLNNYLFQLIKLILNFYITLHLYHITQVQMKLI